MRHFLTASIAAILLLTGGCATRKDMAAMQLRMVDLEAKLTEQATRSEDYLARYQALRDQMALELAKAGETADTIEKRMRDLDRAAGGRLDDLRRAVDATQTIDMPVSPSQAKVINAQVTSDIEAKTADIKKNIEEMRAAIAELKYVTMSNEPPVLNRPVADVQDLDRKVELIRQDILKRINNQGADITSFRSVSQDRFDELSRRLDTMGNAVLEALRTQEAKYSEARDANIKALKTLEPTLQSTSEETPTEQSPKK